MSAHKKVNSKAMYRSLRMKLRTLLAQTPADEYECLIEEANELVERIEANPTLYEPAHCLHPDPKRHGVITKQRGGSVEKMARSQSVVRVIADRVLKRPAVAWFATVYLWEKVLTFWWF